MKMIAKRFFSIFLVFTIFAVGTCTAFASNSEISNNKILIDELIQEEIQLRVDKKMESVYSQLKEQDALEFLDSYKELIWDIEEQAVKLEYNQYSVNGAPYVKSPVRAKYGGYIHFQTQGYNPDGTPMMPLQIMITGMDHGDTLHWLLNKNANTVYDILLTILGATNLKKIPQVCAALSLLNFYISNSVKNEINDAKGYGMNVAMGYGTGENLTSTSSVLLGWDEYPYLPILSHITEYDYKVFPEHDPWS